MTGKFRKLVSKVCPLPLQGSDLDPFMSKDFPHPKHLDESISNFRVVG